MSKSKKEKAPRPPRYSLGDYVINPLLAPALWETTGDSFDVNDALNLLRGGLLGKSIANEHTRTKILPHLALTAPNPATDLLKVFDKKQAVITSPDATRAVYRGEGGNNFWMIKRKQ